MWYALQLVLLYDFIEYLLSGLAQFLFIYLRLRLRRRHGCSISEVVRESEIVRAAAETSSRRVQARDAFCDTFTLVWRRRLMIL